MTGDEKLARLVADLTMAGLHSLVMGGHAVRYYGVERNTNDFDLCAGVVSMGELRELLQSVQELRGSKEGPSWRPDDFARFEIGKLPDGREEWLEFWVHNHLLDSYDELAARQEKGTYGGGEVAFLSLEDLLRSKETERENDWADIALLEEVLDSRHLSKAGEAAGLERLLSTLRSRRGFDLAIAAGHFADVAVVERAATQCSHPVSFAFLAPLIKQLPILPRLRVPIDSFLLEKLHNVPFGESQHRAIVEVVRRGYKRWAMEVDRQDKQSKMNERRGGSK
jgi:hypothetical protein